MKRAETTSTFNGGLIMDINPIVADNSTLCNALNATLITMNGNEYALLNDMGNGRVETAYLPEGYIPVGTTELGGIIYIVSYNPLIDKCLIGSFPSPERNISTEELSDLVVTVSNNEFLFLSDQEGSLKTLLLKKELLNTSENVVINPGDKFIVYGKNLCLTNNGETISDFKNSEPNSLDTNPRYLKLSIAAIDDNNKITYLDENLKWFDYSDGYYIIPELDDQSGTTIPDLDSYRSLIQSPYNVFLSKVSGRLVLIAELVTIDTFSCTWDIIDSSIEGDNSKATIGINCSWTDSYDENIHPKYIILDSIEYLGLDANEPTSNSYCLLYDTDSSEFDHNQQVSITLGEYTYSTDDLDQKYIIYSICPSMPFGKLDYLSISSSINFSEIGSGKISLSMWRYYVLDNSILLNLGLEAYPERNKSISGIQLHFYPYDGSEKAVMTIENRSSYNGSFMESITLNTENPSYKITGTIKSDCLYYVVIVVLYGTSETSENRYYSRWLYTSPIFNEYYLDGTTVDFDELELNLNLSATNTTSYDTNSSTTTSIPELVYELNAFERATDIEPYMTLGVDSIQISGTCTVTITPTLQTGYDIYTLNQDIVSYLNSLEDKNITLSNYKQQHEGYSSDNDILTPIIDLDGSTEYPSVNIWDEEDSYLLYVDAFNYNMTSGENSNIIGLSLEGISHTKAYAEMQEGSISYTSTVSPMIHDAITASNHNIELDYNERLICKKYLFISWESLDESCHAFIGTCIVDEGMGITSLSITKSYTKGSSSSDGMGTYNSTKALFLTSSDSPVVEIIRNIAGDEFNSSPFVPVIFTNLNITSTGKRDGNPYDVTVLGPYTGYLSPYYPGYDTHFTGNNVDSVATSSTLGIDSWAEDYKTFSDNRVVAGVMVRSTDGIYYPSANFIRLGANSLFSTNSPDRNIADMIFHVGTNLYIKTSDSGTSSAYVIEYVNYNNSYTETWTLNINSILSVPQGSDINENILILPNGDYLNNTLISNIKETPISEFGEISYISEASNNNVNPIIENYNYTFPINYTITMPSTLITEYRTASTNVGVMVLFLDGHYSYSNNDTYSNSTCYVCDYDDHTLYEFSQRDGGGYNNAKNNGKPLIRRVTTTNLEDFTIADPVTDNSDSIYLPGANVSNNIISFTPPTFTYSRYIYRQGTGLEKGYNWVLRSHSWDKANFVFPNLTNFLLDYDTYIFKPSATSDEARD